MPIVSLRPRLDSSAFVMLRSNLKRIQDDLIAEVDRDFGVYDGRSFRSDRFQKWVQKERIQWPLKELGKLSLDKVTFKEMALLYPPGRNLKDLIAGRSGSLPAEEGRKSTDIRLRRGLAAK